MAAPGPPPEEAETEAGSEVAGPGEDSRCTRESLPASLATGLLLNHAKERNGGTRDSEVALLWELRKLLELHQQALQDRLDKFLLRQEELAARATTPVPENSGTPVKYVRPPSPSVRLPRPTSAPPTANQSHWVAMERHSSAPSLGLKMPPVPRPGPGSDSVHRPHKSMSSITNGSKRTTSELDGPSAGPLARAYQNRNAVDCLSGCGSSPIRQFREVPESQEGIWETEDAGVLGLPRGVAHAPLTHSYPHVDEPSDMGIDSILFPHESLSTLVSKFSGARNLGFCAYWHHRLFGSVTPEGFFDFVSGVMIFVNAVLIGVETEFMVSHGGASSLGFVVAQLTLNIWFTLELLIRIARDNFRFFTASEWKWNLFDASMVFFSLVDVFQVATNGFDGGVNGTSNVLRIVRLARVVRTLRLCRSLNYLHHFRKMVYSLQASITTLGWSLVLLFTVMYAFAILFVQGIAEYASMGEQPLLQDDFGSLPQAVVTLYKAIANGQSWGVLLRPLNTVDSAFPWMFLCYVSISFFGVLNVVSAVFVESAMASAAHYKDLRIFESRKAKSELVRHMKEVFRAIDEDASGTINFAEMDHFLTDPQLKQYVESLEVTVEDTAMLFQLMDANDSGVVDIEEFCTGLLRLQGDAKSFDVHLLIFEMSKFQKQWDKFTGYVELMFNEVIGMVRKQEMPRQRDSLRSHGGFADSVSLHQLVQGVARGLSKDPSEAKSSRFEEGVRSASLEEEDAGMATNIVGRKSSAATATSGCLSHAPAVPPTAVPPGLFRLPRPKRIALG